MQIFIDESGTFVPAQNVDSYCVVAAFAAPERAVMRIDELMKRLCLEHSTDEVKINVLSEARLIRFLRDLSKLGGLAFTAAVDVSFHPLDEVKAHQIVQSEMIMQRSATMIHQEGKDAVAALGLAFKSLPPQLYTQLQVQIELLHRVICRSTLYFAQHQPEALADFVWYMDQKNIAPDRYERAFQTVLPISLQSKFLRNPIMELVEADYSYLQRFEFANGEYPTYLKDEYGIDTKGHGLNAKKMLANFNLVNSKNNPGVQAADLLASTTRKLLRGGFTRSHEIAIALGSNMIECKKHETVIQFLSLARTGEVSARTAGILTQITKHAKPLLSSKILRGLQ